ncbi:hypothetical protein V8E53_004979 [Lactarius tabidus]
MQYSQPMSDEQYIAVLKASYDDFPQSTDEIEIKKSQFLLLVEKTDDDRVPPNLA